MDRDKRILELQVYVDKKEGTVQAWLDAKEELERLENEQTLSDRQLIALYVNRKAFASQIAYKVINGGEKTFAQSYFNTVDRPVVKSFEIDIVSRTVKPDAIEFEYEIPSTMSDVTTVVIPHMFAEMDRDTYIRREVEYLFDRAVKQQTNKVAKLVEKVEAEKQNLERVKAALEAMQ